jgi:8-oxo-dGTP pyrophosphatase MutT (NUDIX family)
MELVRDVARVLLLSEHDEILLLAGSDPTQPTKGHWWFTPGGGLEESESFHEAAARELFEETGFQGQVFGEPLWERVASFEFMGQLYRQREFFFTLRTARFEPAPALLTEVEQQSFLRFKWWSRSELLSTSEVVYPVDLAELYEQVLNHDGKTTTLLPEQRIG